MKAIYYDLETTGVKHYENGIHQISGIIEIDGEVKEEFDLKVCPNPNMKIESAALEVGNVTLEQVLAYPAMPTIYRALVNMLAKYVNKFDKKDKFFLIGYNNASFDNQFLRAFFEQNGDIYFGSWFWANSLDVMVLASEHLKDVRNQMVDFKLKTVAKQVGIEIDETKLHNATYDIYLTREIYKICTLNKN